MKNLVKLFIILLLITACKKESEPQPDKGIIHIPYTIYVDSLVMHDAIYVDYDYMVLPPESLKSGAFIPCPIYAKMVFDSINNISAKYLGGWKDTTPPFYIPIFIPDIEHDSYQNNGIGSSSVDSIVIDTIFETRIRNISYAILEVTNGKTTSIDTAYYNLFDSMKELQDEIDNPEILYNPGNEMRYGLPVTEYLVGDIVSTELNLESFYKISLSEKKTNIYLVDFWPYWYSKIELTTMVYFVQGEN